MGRQKPATCREMASALLAPAAQRDPSVDGALERLINGRFAAALATDPSPRPMKRLQS